jgi:hypothetical protein
MKLIIIYLRRACVIKFPSRDEETEEKDKRDSINVPHFGLTDLYPAPDKTFCYDANILSKISRVFKTVCVTV